MGYEGVREVVALLFFIFTFLVCLISPGRVATTLAILAFISGLAGYALERMEPSTTIALILVFIGAVSAFVVATYALGYATLAPGRVTFHRVLGAIALYLNIGQMFAAIYRMIWYFIPSSLTNIPGDAGWPAYGQILYFSFVTLHRPALATSCRSIPLSACSSMSRPSSANCIRRPCSLA